MLGIRVLFVLNIILFQSFNGKCAVVNKDNTFHLIDDTKIIESQSIGRIVNRMNHKEINQNVVPQPSYLSDITRTTNIDRENPCPHASPGIPQTNAALEPKLNESPQATRTEFVSNINSQSSYSSDFQLQIQTTRPVQHIHYHYLVPNTPPKPPMNDVSQSDPYTYNLNSQNKHLSVGSPSSLINGNNLLYTNREITPVNPLYSAVDNKGGYLYDSPDEHQGQASENTSVYEVRHPGEISIAETQSQEEAVLKTTTKMYIKQPTPSPQVEVVSPNPPEVYFIKIYGDETNKTLSSTDTQNQNNSSNEVSDGSGLIDIRAGINDILDSQVEVTTPYNEHSAYNVPLN